MNPTGGVAPQATASAVGGFVPKPHSCVSEISGPAGPSIPVRLRLPASEAAAWLALPPRVRARALAAVLVCYRNGVDLGLLIASCEQLRRLGVLLNQSLRSYGDRLGVWRHCVTVVNFINQLQGR